MSHSIRCPYCRKHLEQTREDYVHEDNNTFAYLIQLSCKDCGKKFYQTIVLTEDQPKPFKDK